MHRTGVDGAENVIIGTSSVACDTDVSFVIQLDNLHEKACMQLAARFAGTPAKLDEYGIDDIGIDGVSLLNADRTLNPTIVSSECGDVGDMEICLIQ